MHELQVTVKRATNLRDVQLIGKQDPYCIVQVGARSFRSRVHDNGGKNPVWNDTFVFPVMDPQTEQLVVIIKDSNWVSDEFIGTCLVPVNAFLHGQMVDQWYPVSHGRRQKGTINMSIQLQNASTAGYPGYPQPYPSHQPSFSAQPGYPAYSAHPAPYPQPTFAAQPGYPGYYGGPPIPPPPPAFTAQPGYPAYSHSTPSAPPPPYPGPPPPYPGYQAPFQPTYPGSQPGYPGYQSSQV
ncbi:unnamed protein product [Aphanomyces euteiches]|uniref:C2 domain-containing protein n=1 Tax=Aphanomyces euteiches TaxID=100861 RepID=A0A6G0X1T3_9STRA|nr:hypothetical protein Ae201684_009388 [Aphanomyces euteiches]KAH9070591.1 hypothetical protein Ae201684P_002948 [Aphanomyces euteiches]KAH9115863.1 hypothetical protein AeMF1_010144 [Aphanomyces euteiches]KAH9120179.1 hypothetical protein LEN26_011242 [Aphanomyces euteiches]KAH9155401.1 hypothetical protein AeRB84_002633 [Aphanomyces euteiches]